MTKNRPLAPHIQIYKLPLTGIASIAHRITGVILALGLAFYVTSFFIILDGSATFLAFQAYLNTALMRIVIWCFIYALFFHLCHGIRHLLWDLGKGFAQVNMNRNVLLELTLSLVLTLVCY